MAKEELVEFDGLITELLPEGRFRVRLENDHEILAYTAGKMKKNRIRSMVGDKVTVEMTPYDMDRGRITFRHRDATPRVEHHLTGQELCEAIRVFSLNQFGLMSRVVLKNWKIESTADFGELVYNMIGVGLMKKSKGDDRKHFDNVYDFESAFQGDLNFCKRKLRSQG